MNVPAKRVPRPKQTTPSERCSDGVFYGKSF